MVSETLSDKKELLVCFHILPLIGIMRDALCQLRVNLACCTFACLFYLGQAEESSQGHTGAQGQLGNTDVDSLTVTVGDKLCWHKAIRHGCLNFSGKHLSNCVSLYPITFWSLLQSKGGFMYTELMGENTIL